MNWERTQPTQVFQCSELLDLFVLIIAVLEWADYRQNLKTTQIHVVYIYTPYKYIFIWSKFIIASFFYQHTKSVGIPILNH